MRFIDLMSLTGDRAGVYIIRNKVNGRVYVGQSSDIVARWSKHITELKRGIHPSLQLLEDYQNYGIVALDFSVIEPVSDRQSRFYAEAYWIGKLRPEYNFNNKSHLSAKTRQKAPYPTADMDENEETQGEKQYKTANEIEIFLASKPRLMEAVVSNDVTVRELAALVGGSVATTGRVIKKMRGS